MRKLATVTLLIMGLIAVEPVDLADAQQSQCDIHSSHMIFNPCASLDTSHVDDMR